MVATSKVWYGRDTGNEGNWNTQANWEPTKFGSGFQWTQSPAVSTEYYLEASGGGDPGLVEPGAVYEGGTAMTPGTVGSLAAGEWDWGNNDTLGFNTVYVRLTAGGDPDSQYAGYVSGTLIPAAGDSVFIPPGSYAISAGLDQSGVAINEFRVLPGYREKIGVDDNVAEPTYLRIDPDSLYYEGIGTTAYIDIGSANIATTILNAGSGGQVGKFGLNLRGSNISTATVEGGNVAIAGRDGETSTVATARVGSAPTAALTLGAGVSLTTAQNNGGTLVLRCAATTVNAYAGLTISERSGTVGTWNCEGGQSVPNSAGTITTFNLNGGSADFMQATVARTVTTMNIGNKGEKRLRIDPSVVTITTGPVDPTQPYTMQIGQAV